MDVMSQGARAVEGERLDPATAFVILASETRLQILRVLFEEKFRSLPFAELRKRVGMRDGSQFNYHLKKLEGPFVRRTEDGFQIRHAGLNVIRSIVEGSFTDHPRIPPFETGGVCVECGGPLLAEYKHEGVFVTCSTCQTRHAMGMFPPGAVADRTEHELLEAFNSWQRHDFELAADGVCSLCGGANTEIMIRDAGDVQIKLPSVDPTDFPAFELGIKYQCTTCDAWDFGTAGHHLLTNPDVVTFHRDYGIELDSVPFWELDWVISNQRTTVLAENPVRFQVSIPLANEVLRVTLDESFDVTDVERTQRESAEGSTVGQS